MTEPQAEPQAEPSPVPLPAWMLVCLNSLYKQKEEAIDASRQATINTSRQHLAYLDKSLNRIIIDCMRYMLLEDKGNYYIQHYVRDREHYQMLLDEIDQQRLALLDKPDTRLAP